MATDGSADCVCHRCIKENDIRGSTDPDDVFMHALPLSATRMIVCDKCGNKRCPRASDHSLPCTSSDDSGQYGSVYA